MFRERYCNIPDLDVIPPFRAVTSTKNITRERGWRPIREDELNNILMDWKAGQIDAGFREQDPVHVYVPIHFPIPHADMFVRDIN